MRQPYHIYIVTLLGSNNVYVGCNRDPRGRLKSLVSQARRDLFPDRRVHQWIRSLTAEEVGQLQVSTLEVVKGKVGAGLAEEKWRASFEGTELDLLNMVSGGGGLQSDRDRMLRSARALGRDPRKVASQVRRLRRRKLTMRQIATKAKVSLGTVFQILSGRHV